MSKIVLFWILGVASLALLIGGGSWMFFEIWDKAKKRKIGR